MGYIIRETSPVAKCSYTATILLKKLEVKKGATAMDISAEDLVPVGLALVAVYSVSKVLSPLGTTYGQTERAYASGRLIVLALVTSGFGNGR